MTTATRFLYYRILWLSNNHTVLWHVA